MDEWMAWVASRFAETDWRWELFGLVGEGLFFARLIVQWTASERARKPVLPIEYWYMSLVGAVMLVFYGVHKGSAVVLLPQFIGVPMYARNLQLELRHRAYEAWRKEMGFDKPDFPWPKVSILVPAHNEEKTIAPVLECLLEQEYPNKEIIIGLNACTDKTADVARKYDVQVVESDTAGISHGRNIAAEVATGEILFFIDADTTVEPEATRRIAEAMHGHENVVVGLPGKPDRGGPVVRICFRLANLYTRRKRVSPPGGATILDRSAFDTVNGFDENLPQGTNTDLIIRALDAGAEYLWIPGLYTVTSIRRFEKTGIIRQMLDWRQNHRLIQSGQRDKVEKKDYDVIR